MAMHNPLPLKDDFVAEGLAYEANPRDAADNRTGLQCVVLLLTKNTTQVRSTSPVGTTDANGLVTSKTHWIVLSCQSLASVELVNMASILHYPDRASFRRTERL